jgi:multidrug efflux pump subunit AcrA (membrane-fusion protein)
MKFIPIIVTCCSLMLVFSACDKTPETRPRRRDIVDAVFASGNITRKDQYKVIANADGYLKDVRVTEGDTVNRGQLLFRLSGEVQQTQVLNARDNYRFALSNYDPHSPQMEQLNLQIAQAQQKYTVDSANYRRYQRLLPGHAIAQVDYDNARLTMQASANNLGVLEKNRTDLQRTLSLNKDNARAQLRIQDQNNDYYQLPAATNGVVLSVTRKAGELVRKGDVLAEIGAGRVIIKLFIAEDDISQVQVNQRVLVSLNTNKTQVYNAQVTKIYPSFDDSDQSFIAEAAFTGNFPPGLRDGTQLQANIVLGAKKGVLVIPTIYLETGDKVILKEGNREVPVKTGIRNLDYTEILDGLTENQVIVLPKR